MLATGSTDARVNLYNIATTAPPRPVAEVKPSLLPMPVAGAQSNREIGTLSHHESTIAGLYFPSRSKLLSASTDNTIAVTRTHDWFKMSSFKAPIPRAAGRPSGDTAAAGEVPAGVNDFAVHPSQRLMISVGQGDKSMRLWNMLTGRREGQLEFSRSILTAVGASRWRGAEGRRIAWSDDGIELAVAFERGVAIYGLDLVVRGIIKPASPQSKICEIRYLTRRGEQGNVLAISTEDGRVIFFGTDEASLDTATAAAGANATNGNDSAPPFFKPLAHLGPLPVAGARASRIKDFAVLKPLATPASDDDGNGDDNDGSEIQVSVPEIYYIVTATSEGTVKTWSLRASELDRRDSQQKKKKDGDEVRDVQVGEMLGSYETGRRITCLEGFIMDEEDLSMSASTPLGEGAGPAAKKSSLKNAARDRKTAAGEGEVESVSEIGSHGGQVEEVQDGEGGEFGGFSDEE